MSNGAMSPIARQCPVCGVNFETTSHRRTYCSDDCRRGSHICATCGKTFHPAKNTKAMYCSTTCHYTAMRLKAEMDCPVCGKRFYPATKLQKTCSRECAGKLKHVGARAEFCEWCGEPIQWKRGMKSDQRFCSRACGLAFTHLSYKPRREDGAVRKAGHGYVDVKRNGVWIKQHKGVVEARLGRPLLPNENVHHKNGDRSDNSDENLELWVVTQPKGQRVEDLLDFVIENYREELLARL